MRTILVQGEKNFTITLPPKARITFGPWSPKNSNNQYQERYVSTGTLRIYQGTTIIGLFTGVSSFQDISLGYNMTKECNDLEVKHDLLKASGHLFCWKCGEMLQGRK